MDCAKRVHHSFGLLPSRCDRAQGAGSTGLIVEDYDVGGTPDILIVHPNNRENADVVVYLGETVDINEIPFEQAKSTNAGSTVDRVAVSDVNDDGIDNDCDGLVDTDPECSGGCFIGSALFSGTGQG